MDHRYCFSRRRFVLSIKLIVVFYLQCVLALDWLRVLQESTILVSFRFVALVGNSGATADVGKFARKATERFRRSLIQKENPIQKGNCVSTAQESQPMSHTLSKIFLLWHGKEISR